MTDIDGKRFSIYAQEPLRSLLAATDRGSAGGCGSRSGRIGTIAERYAEIVARAMPTLTEAEWLSIVDTNNGTILDLVGVQGLHWNLDDYAAEQASKWGVDVHALVKRIAAMPYASKVAIAEVVDRFWAKSSGRKQMATRDALVAAGASISVPAGAGIAASDQPRRTGESV